MLVRRAVLCPPCQKYRDDLNNTNKIGLGYGARTRRPRPSLKSCIGKSGFPTIMKSVVALLFLSGTNGYFYYREKCYPPYGCFNNRFPYDNTNYVPVKPKEIGIKLALNNRVNPDLSNPDFLSPTDSKYITNSRFDASKRVVLIIHGFQGSCMNHWVGTLANRILAADDVNVICVDWHKGARTKSYKQATANTRLVGKMVAYLLTLIYDTMGTSFYDMHIIGHSLGSHIAGYVGRFIPGLLGRISGLDPAGLKFARHNTLIRLHPADAMFIDVIHTDDDTIFQLGWGTGVPMGDLDFYPNGGENQPGCSKSVSEYVSNLFSDIEDLSDQVSCSHMRAIHLYISSIDKRNKLIGRRCKSFDDYNNGRCETYTALMGYWATPPVKPGKYYLKTTGVKPYVI